ncbi:Cyclin-dependent kinase 2 [Trebouxia sp. C0010 RCD-2024]
MRDEHVTAADISFLYGDDEAVRQNSGTLRPLEKAAVRYTMRQLAQALAFTHQQGITHRDVKPENVLQQDKGNIALCDFGISKDIISGA